jgi:hypothetical protein
MASETITWQLDVAGYTHCRLNVTDFATYGVMTYRAQAIATPFTINPGSGGGGGGASMVDDAAFTVGTTEITPMGGTYRSSRDSVNDGDGGCVAITAIRGQFVTLESVAGVSLTNTRDASVQTSGPDNSVSRLISTSGTNLTTAKSAAGVLAGYSFFNSSATPVFLKFYDASSPTVGSTAPKLTIMLPASSGANSPSVDMQIVFGTAIKYAVTTGYADADSTGIAAGDVVGYALYR